MVSAECASGSDTLTTEGCSGCEELELCVGYTSTSSCSGSNCVTDGDCTYECLSVDNTSTTLVVLVTFGDYESSEEVAARDAGSYDDAELSSSGYEDYTSYWPWVSNNQVTNVDTISLSSSVKTFMLSGGNSSMQYPKSKVANVTLGPDFISLDTSVTGVVLHNLNLKDQVDSLSSLLPSSVQSLNIGNGLIQSFPTALSGLPSLQELYMDMNYVTSVDSSEVIDSLTYLSLQQNDLNSFTAVFPNLEYLYLNDNNFTRFPAAIYKHTKLTELYLTGNSFASMRFTQSEIDFLDNLTVLHLASSDFSVDLTCDVSKKTVVHDVTLCLSDKSDAAGASSLSDTGSSSSEVLSTTTSSDSSSSISVGAIVGIVCAAVVVFAIVIGFFMYRRRQKQNERDKLAATDEIAGNYQPEGDAERAVHTYAGSTQCTRY
ncbi:hypothetical protein PHYBOEH_006779 [Phytophthora boehmeriae]|uniref:TKL protein kinase n=1 Tax=Phytophthora boehmeriae TaxID=109152 RepID=A0A8T1WAX3_9STRA|nr:hypothetical protein PHYBOEH_006779 [Phytophthora boehmeriae]